MFFHGNSNKNDKLHHLYGIYDKEDDGLFKYGISHDPIDNDGLSDRSRDQINFLNLAVNWERFYVKILIANIPGREKAKIIETQFIDTFCEKNGHNPRGNLKN
ncbi:MAG: hypothetical protein U5L45_13305 [Saprospiraceae bacterium]|nr:hypothetical protein [Saprospiraceae bacterium]